MSGLIAQLWRLDRAFRKHPLTADAPGKAWLRWLAWQARARAAGGAVDVAYLGDTRLRVRRGQAGATGNIYFGLQEAADQAFVAHLLRPEDVFIDVGANVGAYTVLAAGVCGARVRAYEPVPSLQRDLRANIALNGLDALATAYAVAVGEAEGEVTITDSLDVTNHVVVGRAAAEADGRTRVVPVAPLDALLADRPSGRLFLKIDVEGYEAAAVAGAPETLASPELIGMLLELTPQAERYGFDDAAVHAGLLARGFAPYSYDPFTRRLTPRVERERRGNMLYLKDVAFAEARVAAAPPLRVHDRTL